MTIFQLEELFSKKADALDSLLFPLKISIIKKLGKIAELFFIADCYFDQKNRFDFELRLNWTDYFDHLVRSYSQFDLV